MFCYEMCITKNTKEKTFPYYFSKFKNIVPQNEELFLINSLITKFTKSDLQNCIQNNLAIVFRYCGYFSWSILAIPSLSSKSKYSDVKFYLGKFLLFFMSWC